MILLRQSTAQNILVGPVVDIDDGATPVTGLSPASSGARLAIVGQSAIDVTSRTWSHLYAGHYIISLLSGDVPVIGQGKVILSNASLFLPLFPTCAVVDQAIYDAYLTENGILALRANITVGPIIVTENPMNTVGPPVKLSVFRGEAKTFTISPLDGNGDPYDCTGKTLRFTVETAAEPSVSQFDVTSGFVITTTTVQVPTDDAANLALIAGGDYEWRLWDVTVSGLPIVIGYGAYAVVQTSEE